MVDTAAPTRIRIPLCRVAINYRRDGKKEVIYSEQMDGETVQQFFTRIGKTVDDLLTHVTDDIRHVRFTPSSVESDQVL